VTHGPVLIGYPESHWIVALYAFFWIERELAWRRRRPAPRTTEALGRASYSLYLVHTPVIAVFGFADAPSDRFGALGWTALWLAQSAAIILTTFTFYRLCEAPFHRLARRLGGKFAGSGPTLAGGPAARPLDAR
jgi:peptidoglycan/LPS O-acetylase OafA/YrhL